MAVGVVQPLAVNSRGENARGAVVSPFPTSTPVSDAGAGMSALGDFAQQYARRLQKDNDERDNIRAVEAEGEFRIGVERDVSKLDPLAADYRDQVKTVTSNHRQMALDRAGLTTDTARRALDARLSAQEVAATVSADGMRRGSLQEEAVRVYGKAADAVFAAIRKNPGDYQAQLEAFRADSTRLTEGMSPDVRRKIADKFATDALLSVAQGYIEGKNFGAARKWVDDNQGAITPDTFRSIKGQIREAEAQARADGERWTGTFVADAQTSIYKAVKLAADENITYAEAAGRIGAPTLQTLDDWSKDGKFNGPSGAQGRAHLTHMLTTLQTRGNEERSRNEQAVREFNSGGFSNGDMATRAWMQFQQDVIKGRAARGETKPLPDADTALMLGAFVQKGGYLPENFQKSIAAADNTASDDPGSAQRLAQAARLLDQVKAMAPNAKGLPPLGEDSRIRMIQARVEMSGDGDYAAAAKEVAAMTKIDVEQYTKRAKSFHDASKGIDFTAKVTDVFAKMNVFDRALGAANPYIDPAATSDYKEALKASFAQGADLATATKVADKRIAELYGVSTVGGAPNIVRHPMEKFFPKTLASLDMAQRAAVMDHEIATELARVGVLPAQGKGFLADLASKYPTLTSILATTTAPLTLPAAGALAGARGLAGVDPSKDLGFRLQTDSITDAQASRGELPTARVQVRGVDGVWKDAPVGRYRVPNQQQVEESPVYKKLVGDLAAPNAAAGARSELQDRVTRQRRVMETNRMLKGAQ